MNRPPKAKSKMKAYVIYGGLGLSLCTEIAVAGLLGWWLGGMADRKLSIKPWGTTLGLVIFVTLSFVHIIRTLQSVSDRFDKEGD